MFLWSVACSKLVAYARPLVLLTALWHKIVLLTSFTFIVENRMWR